MGSFFHTEDGLRRGTFHGCIYLFIALLYLSSDGWLLVAVGFFTWPNPKPGPSKWRSPSYWIGFGTTALGLGLMVYHVHHLGHGVSK